jgi:excisionase family DNA binding protein
MAFTLQEHARADKLAYTPAEAAAMLGVSRRTFDRRILGQLRIVREGRCILVPRRELERYIERGLDRLDS